MTDSGYQPTHQPANTPAFSMLSFIFLFLSLFALVSTVAAKPISYDQALALAYENPSNYVPAENGAVRQYFSNKPAVDFYKFLALAATNSSTGEFIYYLASNNSFAPLGLLTQRQLDEALPKLSDLSSRVLDSFVEEGLANEYGVSNRTVAVPEEKDIASCSAQRCTDPAVCRRHNSDYFVCNACPIGNNQRYAICRGFVWWYPTPGNSPRGCPGRNCMDKSNHS